MSHGRCTAPMEESYPIDQSTRRFIFHFGRRADLRCLPTSWHGERPMPARWRRPSFSRLPFQASSAVRGFGTDQMRPIKPAIFQALSLFDEAHLRATNVAHCVGQYEPGLAGRRDDFHGGGRRGRPAKRPRRYGRDGDRAFRSPALSLAPRRAPRRRHGLETPSRRPCFASLCEFLGLLVVEGRLGGRTDHALVLGIGHVGRLARVVGEHLPARCGLPGKPDRRGQVVDAGLSLVRGVLLVPEPRSSRRRARRARRGPSSGRCR